MSTGLHADARGALTANAAGELLIGMAGEPCCCGDECPCNCPGHNDPNIGITYGTARCQPNPFNPNLPAVFTLFPAIARPLNTGSSPVYKRVRYTRNWRVSIQSIDSQAPDANLWILYSVAETWCQNYLDREPWSCSTYEGIVTDYVSQTNNAQTTFSGDIMEAFARGLAFPWLQVVPEVLANPFSRLAERDAWIPPPSLNRIRFSSLFGRACESYRNDFPNGFNEGSFSATDSETGSGSLTYLEADSTIEPPLVQSLRTSLVVTWTREFDCRNTLAGGGGGGGSLTGDDCPGCGAAAGLAPYL